jgi:para-aminobenzoate synthetase/4-amino-4-deoxychorismate lyase
LPAGHEAERDEHPYAADVLMVNRMGELTGSTLGNVAVRFGTVWWTPWIASGVLPGVFREELLACGEIQERPIRREELFDADDVAIINSVSGWRPAAVVADGVDCT